METKPKNRAWVKDAAIVFLVVLLILTFFSNTIMNHSLPEVATQMVTDGTITAKVRGTGTVEALGDHKVKAKSNLNIAKVMVKAGQEVNAGDVLFILGAADDDELDAAIQELENLQTKYSQNALSVPIMDQFVAERNALDKAKKAMDDAYSAWKEAEKDLDDVVKDENSPVKGLLEEKDKIETQYTAALQKLEQEKLVLSSVESVLNSAMADYEQKYTKWKESEFNVPEVTPTPPAGGGAVETPAPSNTPTGAADTSGEVETANAEPQVDPAALIDAAQNILMRPFAKVGTNTGASGSEEPDDVKEARLRVEALQAEYKAKQEEAVQDSVDTDLSGLQRVQYITRKQYKVDTLQLKLKAINDQLDKYGGNTANVSVAKQAYLDALDTYEEAQYSLNKQVESQNRSIASAGVGLSAISKQIERQQEKIKKLSGEGDENTITANVAGTVTEVNYTAGDTVVKDDILCSIEVPDMGYTVSFSVTNDQARRLHVGDTATISNFYWGNQIVATLASIQTDKKNPTTNKTLTFNLEGDVNSGAELTVSVGQKSARYDTIIPNSAIRTDSNGSFVLAVTEKSSPLGNRYIAKRVNIEVQAADDTTSAVTADLNYGDYVITTASAPVASGDMVRLTTES